MFFRTTKMPRIGQEDKSSQQLDSYNRLHKQGVRRLRFLGDGDKELLLKNVQLSHLFSEIYQMYQATAEAPFSSDVRCHEGDIYGVYSLSNTIVLCWLII